MNEDFLYFDHTATKQIPKEILEFYIEQLKINNYNPAARYREGIRAAESIRIAQEKIAGLLHCRPSELILTSGATESINTAIKGLVFAPNPKQKRILTSAGEHAATAETLKYLRESFDYQIDICELNPDGSLNLEQYEQFLSRNQYDLISLIAVNNVLGTILPIETAVSIRNRLQAETPIHLDAVQALGKMPFDFRIARVELASFSLHKIGTPKGIGLLYKSEDTRIVPLLHGGGQQNNLRSGTENPALVCTAAFAVTRTLEQLTKNCAFVQELKAYLFRCLDQAAVNYQRISPAEPDKAVPHIIAIAFPELRAETLLNVLSKKGIGVSIGSACSSKKSERNSVLRQLHLPGNLDQYVLRISLAETNTKEEIDQLVKKIAFALAKYAVK